MIDKSRTQLLIGIILIVISFLCVAGIFYVVGHKNQSQVQKISSLEVQLASIVNEKAASQLPAEDYQRAKGEALPNNDTGLFSAEELARREGILWIDRENQSCMVTLGRIHGLAVDSRLAVYQQNRKIGDIRVETPLDTISYVVPVDKTIEDFEKNYYRVEIE